MGARAQSTEARSDPEDVYTSPALFQEYMKRVFRVWLQIRS